MSTLTSQMLSICAKMYIPGSLCFSDTGSKVIRVMLRVEGEPGDKAK